MTQTAWKKTDKMIFSLTLVVLVVQSRALEDTTAPAAPCLPATSCDSEEEMWIDLDSTGSIVGSIPNVVVTSPVTGLIKGVPCSRQVVLKATFDPVPTCSSGTCQSGHHAGERMLKVELFYGSTKTGWTFNIGDSPQNNGYGGDFGYTDYEAEVQGVNAGVAVYANDVSPCSAQLLYSNPSALGSGVTRLNVWVANYYLKLANNLGFCYRRCDTCLFGLNGQPNSGSVNYDMHVAANRVIYATSGRVGSGLCSMKLSWVDGPEA